MAQLAEEQDVGDGRKGGKVDGCSTELARRVSGSKATEELKQRWEVNDGCGGDDLDLDSSREGGDLDLDGNREEGDLNGGHGGGEVDGGRGGDELNGGTRVELDGRGSTAANSEVVGGRFR
ncbi:hypothetical protein ACP4OV_004808 [Aristida adscensionis]